MSTATAGAARDQVGRLLRLVPYLHGREQVPARRGGARDRRTPRAARARTSACCSCAGCPAATPTT